MIKRVHITLQYAFYRHVFYFILCNFILNIIVTDIKETALTVNYSLMKLISLEPNDPKSESTNKTLENIKTVLDTSNTNKTSALYDQLALSAIVEVLNQLLHHNSVQTKVAVLRWILHLYNKLPVKV